MAYYYAREKRRFDAEWRCKELWYRKEGMSEGDRPRTIQPRQSV